jgi:hypothetical protein
VAIRLPAWPGSATAAKGLSRCQVLTRDRFRPSGISIYLDSADISLHMSARRVAAPGARQVLALRLSRANDDHRTFASWFLTDLPKVDAATCVAPGVARVLVRVSCLPITQA